MPEWANPGAALGQGLNAGAAFGGKVVDANREREQHGLEQDSRQAAAGAVDAGMNADKAILNGDTKPGAIPTPDQTQNHVGFLQSLGQSLAHAGNGISSFFGGGAPGATGAPPAGALPPQPAAPGQGAIPGPGAPPAGPPMGAAPTANVQGGVAMMAEGGPVEASPGGYASPGAALVNGANAGANFGGSVVAASRERQQHEQDQQDRQAAAQYADAATQPDPNSAAVAPPDSVAAKSHVDHIEDFADHLVQGALNDAGVPNGKQGIAPPTPPQQLAQVAQNPAAAKGIPEKGAAAGAPSVSTGTSTDAGTSHSLSTDYWDKSDAMLSKAVRASALAGHDPDATFTALNHMRTSFIQGHMLRNLSAANVALQNGDMKGVEQGLHNMNYYLPNGENLNIQKDDGGNLVYQNPMQPYLDAQGQPTDAKTGQKNMIPVDAQHLQMLGTAILDPMKVNDILVNARSAAAKQMLERARAVAAQTTANAADKRGTAAVMTAQSKQQLVPSQIYKNVSQAKYYSDKIGLQIRNATDKPDPLAYKAGQDASTLVFKMAQGQETTAPINEPRMNKDGTPMLDAQGKPMTVQSMSPVAGKSFRDPSKIPSWAQGRDPDQLTQISSLAGELGAANHGRMPAARAVELAAALYTHNGSSHPDPADPKKMVADVKFSKDRSQGWYWNGKAWENFSLSKKTGGALAGGNVDTLDPYDPGADDTDTAETSDIDDARGDNLPAE